MIKNIVFDMGNVLMRFDPRSIIKKYIDDEDDIELIFSEIFVSVEWVLLDYGDMDANQVYESTRKRLPERLHETAYEIVTNWYKHKTLIEGMEDLARELKEEGYNLYLLSNAGTQFYLYRDTLTALKYFEGEFISAQWHLLKPDIKIYRAFCSHFSLIPAECLFIDDFPANIEGAIRSGMKGIIFKGNVEKLKLGLRAEGVNVR